ncbi:hypothetical protein GW17_00019876 [Ensete ventricosum]|nr:hypothetical protein GW17_00019876 [Ensete ventricosum]
MRFKPMVGIMNHTPYFTELIERPFYALLALLPFYALLSVQSASEDSYVFKDCVLLWISTDERIRARLAACRRAATLFWLARG